MDDRLAFNKTILKNKIPVWSQKVQMPFAQIRVIVPIGTSHSHEGNYGGAYGIAHFLEHVCLDRSEGELVRNSFEKQVADAGGNSNAWTTPFETTFFMQAPSSDFNDLASKLIKHIVHPSLYHDDIELHKGIIMSERSLSKYFPANDHFGHYKFTEWAKAHFVLKDQVFGTDETIGSMSHDLLLRFHSNYLSRPFTVIIAGNFDHEKLSSELESITFKEEHLPSSRFIPYEWNRQAFHTMQSLDIDAPVYMWGNFIPYANLNEARTIAFLCDYLTDSEYGVLNDVYRKEMGISYGVGGASWSERERMGWNIDVPVNDEANAMKVKESIHDIVVKAINDETAISVAKDRLIKSKCFAFQTIGERIDAAQDSIITYEANFTETMLVDWILKEVNTHSLNAIYHKHFSPEASGEFIGLPKT